MYIAYCKKCNQFFHISRIRNYCNECRTPLMRMDMSIEEFSELSLNDRYKLAYKLTNNQEKS